MKTYKVVIQNYKYEDRFANMAKHFGVSLEEDCDEYRIRIENSFGIGEMRGINFDSGLSLQTIDGNFTNKIDFVHDLGRRHPILFLYVKEGFVELKSDDDDFIHKVSANESVIFAPNGDALYSLIVPENIQVKVAMVNVVRFLFLSKIECDIDTIPEPLKNMFKDTIGEKAFTYTTVSHPSSINAINNLFDNDQVGLERKLHLEAYSIKLITSLIKTFRIENSPSTKGYFFSKANIKLINDAKNYILANIDDTPTVKELSLKLGINTNKLQKGFHLLFNKSVRQFIIASKLHTAQQMIEEGDRTISEIADRLGYVNKGHFSQLFKKEFGILPSEYNIRSRKY